MAAVPSDLLIFMAGLLFQSCVPRLCHLSRRLGGATGGKAKRCWNWLKAFFQGIQGMEKTSNGETKLPQSTAKRWNTGAWDAYGYSSKHPKTSQYDRDKSARGTKRMDAREEAPSSSIWGPSFPTRRMNHNISERGRMGTAMGAMIAAASPRR